MQPDIQTRLPKSRRKPATLPVVRRPVSTDAARNVLAEAFNRLGEGIDPTERLRAVHDALDALAHLESRAARDAVALGYTMGEIGRATRMTRQSARQRWNPTKETT